MNIKYLLFVTIFFLLGILVVFADAAIQPDFIQMQDCACEAMVEYGGFGYWDFKYPFKHYKEPRYLVATEKAIYEITTSNNQ